MTEISINRLLYRHRIRA